MRLFNYATADDCDTTEINNLKNAEKNDNGKLLKNDLIQPE